MAANNSIRRRIRQNLADPRILVTNFAAWRCIVALCLILAVSPRVLADNTPYQMGYNDRQSMVDVFYFGRHDRYAAIAYSPATGKYGYAQDCYSREIAERSALRNCPTEDARIVTWVCNGFCALATGSDGAWGAAYSNHAKASNTAAKQDALKICQKQCTDASILLCVCSVKRRPEVFEVLPVDTPSKSDSVGESRGDPSHDRDTMGLGQRESLRIVNP